MPAINNYRDLAVQMFKEAGLRYYIAEDDPTHTLAANEIRVEPPGGNVMLVFAFGNGNNYLLSLTVLPKG